MEVQSVNKMSEIRISIRFPPVENIIKISSWLETSTILGLNLNVKPMYKCSIYNMCMYDLSKFELSMEWGRGQFAVSWLF